MRNRETCLLIRKAVNTFPFADHLRPNEKSLLFLNFWICLLFNTYRALGIPVTDHTYEDCRLMISAGQLTLPMEAGLVEFTKISRKLK